MSKATTIEKNNRFYEQPNGEILTENQQLKEWLVIANKEIERLNNIINELENYFNKIKDTSTLEERMIAKYMLKYIKELKGSDKE